MLVDCAGPYARAVGVAMGGDEAALPLDNGGARLGPLLTLPLTNITVVIGP